MGCPAGQGSVHQHCTAARGTPVLPGNSDVSQKNVETSLIERFLYPRLGPGQMWEEVANRVLAGGGEIHLEHRVVGLRRIGQRVEAAEVLDLRSGTSRWIECDQFVSTMPIGTLTTQLQPEGCPVADIACGLPHRDFMTAGLVVRKMTPSAGRTGAESAGMPPDNWIYVQEPEVKLGRLQIFNNWSPDLVADPATISLGLEYFCAEGDDSWSMPDDRFLSFAARELARIGLIDERDVIDGTVVRVPKAYPAYFGKYARMASSELSSTGSRMSMPSAATACTATITRIIQCWRRRLPWTA